MIETCHARHTVKLDYVQTSLQWIILLLPRLMLQQLLALEADPTDKNIRLSGVSDSHPNKEEDVYDSLYWLTGSFHLSVHFVMINENLVVWRCHSGCAEGPVLVWPDSIDLLFLGSSCTVIIKKSQEKSEKQKIFF